MTPTPPNADAPSTPPARKRRRRWPWVIAVLLLLLVALVVLGPTLANTAPVRSLVVSTANKQINGTMELRDYRVGWLAGTQVNGLTLKDRAGREVLAMPTLTTDITLLDLVRGKKDLGQITGVVSNFMVVVNEDGRTNLHDILNLPAEGEPAKPADPKKDDAPFDLGDYRGSVDLTFQGSVETVVSATTQPSAAPQATVVQIRESHVKAKLGDELENDVRIALQLPNAEPATFTAAGKINPRTLVGTQAIEADRVDLAAITPILAAAGMDLALRGVLDGKIDINLTGQGGGANGEMTIAGLYASGGLLNGDTLDLGDITLPLRATGSMDAAGKLTLDVQDAAARTRYGEVGVGGQIVDGQGALKLRGTLEKLEQLVAQLPNTLADSSVPQFASSRVDLGGNIGVNLAAEMPIDLSQGVGFKAAFTNLLLPSEEPETPPITIAMLNAEATVKQQGETFVIDSANPLRATAEKVGGVTPAELEKAVITFVGKVTPGEVMTVVIDDAKVTLPEGEILAKGGVKLSGAESENLSMENLIVSIPTADTVVTLNGTVRDYAVRREMDKVVVKLSHDWPKLLAFGTTLLDEETKASIAGLTMEGRNESTFVLSGSAPVADTTGAMLAPLKASGELQIPRLNHQGVIIEKLIIPVTLEQGLIVVKYADQPKEKRFAPPASFNGGTLDLSGINVDLNGDEPRLNIGRNQALVRNASINPLMSESIGKFINPVFPGSSQARGVLDVTIVKCEGVALGELLTTPKSGNAEVLFSLRDMQLVNPIGKQMLGAVEFLNIRSGGGDVFEGEIKDARLTLANGKLSQNLPLSIGDPTRTTEAGDTRLFTMRFTGDVALDTQGINLAMLIPPDLLDRWTHDEVVKLFPEGLSLQVTGTTIAPKFNVGQSARSAVEKGLQKRIEEEAGGLLEKWIEKNR